ncbi:uncharacterized protein LOC132205454 [Neocloeon triangulifer]|uniref:uncharacterized protein LOC132205454 n=1 Tax=Neocloeon triangulifer TaxID=2078957 RepID=UPI00286F4B6F|nr:uncharacterized protein LOC132205454 [Neocloeon triangulifer]
MRIVLLLAVLFVAAWLSEAMAAGLPANSTLMLQNHRGHRSPRSPKAHLMITDDNWDPYTFIPVKEVQALLMRNGTQDCCPAFENHTYIQVGKNRDGNTVNIAKLEVPQFFVEFICKPQVVNKPCRLADRKLINQTRCVQQYSYSYAAVGNGTEIEHIEVRAGCACKVFPKESEDTKKGHKLRHQHRGQQRHKKSD